MLDIIVIDLNVNVVVEDKVSWSWIDLFLLNLHNPKLYNLHSIGLIYGEELMLTSFSFWILMCVRVTRLLKWQCDNNVVCNLGYIGKPLSIRFKQQWYKIRALWWQNDNISKQSIIHRQATWHMVQSICKTKSQIIKKFEIHSQASMPHGRLRLNLLLNLRVHIGGRLSF